MASTQVWQAARGMVLQNSMADAPRCGEESVRMSINGIMMQCSRTVTDGESDQY